MKDCKGHGVDESLDDCAEAQMHPVKRVRRLNVDRAIGILFCFFLDGDGYGLLYWASPRIYTASSERYNSTDLSSMSFVIRGGVHRQSMC